MSLLLIVALAAAAELTAPATAELAAAPEAPSAGEEEVGPMAPEVSFRDADGATVTLADLRGRAVVLSFWASWCAPCRKELPALDGLAARLDPERAVLLAVSVDAVPRAADQLARRLRLGLPVLYDPAGDAIRAFEAPGLPATYVIDAEGRVAAAYGELDLAELEARVTR